ncbi:hypothetical protein RHMOL_Rhmol03G0017200 [Rhododendron molle]|uniref:Uncharacterized protein n=1 Tax=Rhododendron molle TaxID=49168 RepID=A0ACC0PBS9_RHOML|nr:hypothetical protein RHMOL_Rhmol03G0017200 [Rhododendron molle]
MRFGPQAHKQQACASAPVACAGRDVDPGPDPAQTRPDCIPCLINFWQSYETAIHGFKTPERFPNSPQRAPVACAGRDVDPGPDPAQTRPDCIPCLINFWQSYETAIHGFKTPERFPNSPQLSQSHAILSSSSKTHNPHTPMAETDAGSSEGRGGGDEERPRHETETPEARINDQTAEAGMAIAGAIVSRGDGGNGSHAAEAGGGGDGRTPVDQERVPVDPRPVGPQVDQMG